MGYQTGATGVKKSASEKTTSDAKIEADIDELMKDDASTKMKGEELRGGAKGKIVTNVKYGEHYTKKERKKALKSDVQYVTKEGYKYTTDSNGRISNVTGKLKLEEGVRNPYAQRTVGGDDRRKTDDGGHLIGTQFKGSGDIDNLVPQSCVVNRAGGDWYKMEQEWAKALKNKSTVEVEIKPIYVGNSVRPDRFKVKYWIDGEKISKTIQNK